MRDRLIPLLFASLILTMPVVAQDWGSDYNMGTIGVSGGSETNGLIIFNCAESGNGVVPQGSFSIFLRPAADADATAGDFTFSVDGSDVVLPVGANQGDGFVYEKTPETLAGATQLIELLKSGRELSVSAAGSQIASIDLDGAAAALDGVELCLTP